MGTTLKPSSRDSCSTVCLIKTAEGKKLLESLTTISVLWLLLVASARTTVTSGRSGERRGFTPACSRSGIRGFSGRLEVRTVRGRCVMEAGWSKRRQMPEVKKFPFKGKKTKIQTRPDYDKGASGRGGPTLLFPPYNLLIFPLCLHLDRPCPQNHAAPEVLKPRR